MFCPSFLHVLCYVSDSQSVIVLSLFLLGLQLSFVGRNLYTIPCPTPASAYPFAPSSCCCSFIASLTVRGHSTFAFSCCSSISICLSAIQKETQNRNRKAATKAWRKANNKSTCRRRRRLLHWMHYKYLSDTFLILLVSSWAIYKIRPKKNLLFNKQTQWQAGRETETARERKRREKQGKTMFNCCAGLIYFAFSVSR